MKYLIKSLFCLLVALQICLSSNAIAQQIKEYPQLAGITINGEQFALSRQHGKVTLVFFWVSWCKYCRSEILILERLKADYESRSFNIIGVNLDERSERQKVLEIAERTTFPHIILGDSQYENNKHHKWINDFGESNFVPMNYLIDRNGKLRPDILSNRDIADEKTLRKAIEELL